MLQLNSSTHDHVSQLCQHTLTITQWNSTGAGVIFLAITIPSFASPYVGYLADNYGPRWLAVTGFIFAIPFWVLLRLVTHNTLGQKVLLCALLAFIGLGLCLVMPPLMAEITYVVEAKEKEKPGCFGPTGAYAQAYGLFIAAFAAGSLIGPVWAGYVSFFLDWRTMCWSLALFSFFGAVPCLLWTGGNLGAKNAKTGEERAIGRPTSSSADEEAAIESTPQVQAREDETTAMKTLPKDQAAEKDKNEG